jgi:hypothetical protein
MSNLDYKEGRGDYYLAEGKREERREGPKEESVEDRLTRLEKMLDRIEGTVRIIIQSKEQP